MALDLNKKNIKRIMLLIAFAALLYWGLNNLKWISGVLGSLLDLLSPLLIGICIAFVLNLMMVALERLWDRGLIKWNSPWNAKLKRPVCLTLTLLLFLGIIFAIFFILIPRLEEAGTTLISNIPTYVDQGGFACHPDISLAPALPAAGCSFLSPSFLHIYTGTGISTCCPSTTHFGLALGPDLPRADEPSSGNLGFSVRGILTHVPLLTPAFSLP